MNSRHPTYIILFFSTLATRFPFLFDGYGSEDDSWGLVLNARLMAETGEYSFSRLPGHPVQEYLLALIPEVGPFWMNFLSAFFASCAVVVFADCLRLLNIKRFLAWAVLFSFVPIIYISGTYTIDYAWGLAFILLAWNAYLRNALILCGLWMALAIGSRITSGAVLLGFIWMLYRSNQGWNWKHQVKLNLSVALATLVIFTPVFLQYGLTFFDTYRLPYPSLPKVLVKGTIGVWGFTTCFALVYLLIKRPAKNGFPLKKSDREGMFLIIALYTVAFLVLPQKSAFLIPAIPFLLAFLAHSKLSPKEFSLIGIAFIFGAFSFGLNLNDANRGASYSSLALTARVSGQDVFFDPLIGAVQIEQARRIRRQTYVDKAYQSYLQIMQPTAVLCGWWMNQFSEKIVQTGENPQVVLVEFANKNQLDSLEHLGLELRHLEEIDQVNDSRYEMLDTQERSRILE